MSQTRLSVAALLGAGFVLGFGPPLAFSQSSAPEDELRNDHAICHLESVHTSHHTEEALRDGAMLRNQVTVVEQEYLLQNITSEPVTFVVEHVLPDGYTVDSDPQPVRVVDDKAFFRVHAEPGQIVRMHVGEHHADPIADTN
jgi:hypothetical protein